MATITINGKKKKREFQNMAQALAFAYQSGECYSAWEIVLSSEKEADEAAQGLPAAQGPTEPPAEETGEAAPQNENAAGPDANEPPPNGDGDAPAGGTEANPANGTDGGTGGSDNGGAA